MSGYDIQSFPEGVVTFLMTDIEGSTGLWERHGDEMGEALRRHDRLVGDIIGDHGGRLIKSKGEGDSSLSVFARASEGLAAAADLDRAVRGADWGGDIDVRLRIALHTGECELRDGDYYGQTLNRAARIRSLADGGDILVSDATFQLVADRLPPGSCLLPVGEHELRGLGRPENVFRLRTSSSADPAGSVEAVAQDVLRALVKLVEFQGLPPLEGRHSVLFVFPGTGVGRRYPDLAGCTAELGAFASEAATFAAQGVQLIGLSGEEVVLPDGAGRGPFPIGLLAQGTITSVAVPGVERDGRRYAQRVSYVVFPDGGAVRVSGITDTAAHVRRCYEVAVEHRLSAYRDAVLRTPDALANLPSRATLGDPLPNGSDSVSISRVNLGLELVSKMAAPGVIESEAGYIDRINRLLSEHSLPRMFPQIVAISDREEPAWYLMEAADPTTLDHVLFADELRTVLHPDRQHLLFGAVDKLRHLYELTARPEVPPIAPYHYLDRFRLIPQREDTRATFTALCGTEVSFDEVLAATVVVDGEASYAPYLEQLTLLEAHRDDLLQPVGALLHGDAHLPNMLISADGNDVTFVDPRTVWDGQHNDEPGFGDPLYDLGTLLHSLHVMSTILCAIEAGASESLLSVDTATRRTIEVKTETLALLGSSTERTFIDFVASEFAPHALGAHWRARLHANAANALIGWLKTQRALATASGWYAVFVSALHHLDSCWRDLGDDAEASTGSHAST